MSKLLAKNDDNFSQSMRERGGKSKTQGMKSNFMASGKKNEHR